MQTVLGPAQFSSSGENIRAAQAAAIFQWQPGAGGTGAKFVQVLPGSAPGAVLPLRIKANLSS
jgi:hypothetical protein